MFQKLLLSVFVLVCFSALVNAQERDLAKGTKKFDQYAFVDSQKIFLRVAEEGYESADLFSKLADSFYYNADYTEAAEWYGKLVEKYSEEVTPNQYFRYAQALRAIEDYETSNVMIQKYESLAQVQGDDYYKSGSISEIKSANSLGTFVIERLSANSVGYSDFAPAYFGEKLLFSSTRDTGTLTRRIHSWNNQPFLDLYVADVTNEGQINNVSKFNGSINTEFHESTASLSPDGNTLYFTRNNFTNETYRADKKNTNKLKLYKATRSEDGSFGNVEELPFNSDSFSTAHPAISSDGKTLYFSSDREGTYGESDLWKVEITDSGYGTVENLGATINTPGRDTFPFVDADGKLYFSTDGRGGLGGLDVYVYDADKGGIANLGEPVNSPKDDFTFIYNSANSSGYFASNRSNDPLDDDIYTFTRTACESTLIVQVIDKTTREPLNGALVGLRSKSNELVTSGEAEAPEAKFSYDEPECGSEYFIRAELEGYATAEKNVSIPEESSEVTVVIELEPSIVDIPPDFDLGKLINPIYFDFDESYIRPDAAVELAKIIEIMKEYPQLRIDVRSHTDSRGNDAYNMALSERRNKSTIQYIIDKGGIDSERLTGRGYGESQLLNDCSNGVSCTEEQHQLNRRSEFIVQEY